MEASSSPCCAWSSVAADMSTSIVLGDVSPSFPDTVILATWRSELVGVPVRPFPLILLFPVVISLLCLIGRSSSGSSGFFSVDASSFPPRLLLRLGGYSVRLFFVLGSVPSSTPSSVFPASIPRSDASSSRLFPCLRPHRGLF